jgi:hypothetical protein
LGKDTGAGPAYFVGEVTGERHNKSEQKINRKGGNDMFGKLNALLVAFMTDWKSTFITIFIIGILVCAAGAGFGGDEHAGKFKSALKTIVICLVLYLLAPEIIDYVKAKLG